jgi:hypothetical protein
MRIALSFVLVFAACGGGGAETHPTTAPTSSASASTTASAAPTEAPTAWSDSMSKEQQAAFMKAKVVPTMGPIFQEHDKARYGEFSCKTCHGPAFKVPKDFLPKLTMKDGKLAAFTEKPEMAKWMAEKVMPAMRTAMGGQPYDPATHTGFGCNGCHEIATK